VAIFILDVPFGFVLSEEALEEPAIRLLDPAAAHSAVIDPLAFIRIAVLVVVSAGGVPLIMLKDTLKELSVRKKYLNLPISYAVPIKSPFNNLIRQ